MRGKYYSFAYAAYVLRDGTHDRAQIRRHGVTDRVRNIQRGRASFNYCIQHFAKKIEVGTRSVLRRKLNVRTQRLRQLDGSPRLLQALLARHLELILKMNVGSREENVNARTSRTFQSAPSPLDILGYSTRQTANNRAPNLCRDRLYCRKIAIRRNRKPSFD